MDVLTFDAQRFPARRQDVYIGSRAEYQFGQHGDSLDDVLAIVEDQKQLSLRQRGDQRGDRVARLHGQAKCCCNRACDEALVGERSEVDECDRFSKLPPEPMSDGDGDGRLAHAAGTDDRDESICHQLRQYGFDRIVAADHPCQRGWQARIHVRHLLRRAVGASSLRDL
ncbi:hypothetical protein ACX3P1_22655 [Mesorhizobium sp. A623]